jgi:GT2 family glycosyltransferase
MVRTGKFMPKVSVIVVNWKRYDLLKGCLDSLKDQTFKDFEVVIVDNESRGGLWPLLEPFQRAKVIYNKENEGFARANNQGILAASGKYIALLNNDARANRFWLSELVKTADRNAHAGMFASYVLRSDGTIESMGCAIYPDGNGMCRRAEEYPLVFPSGCAAFYRRSMLDEIGLFNESFFMYNEDTELGLRAAGYGYKCLYVQTALIMHLGSGSSSRNSLKKLYYVERNRIKIMLKHLTWRQIAVSPYWTIRRYLKGGR